MKRLVLILVLAATVSACGLTRQELEAQIRQLIKDQQIELDSAKQRANEAVAQIDTAKKQAEQIAKERDDWRTYGDDQHDKFINAEVRVAKKEAVILKLSITIGLMTLAIGAYLFLRFYMRLPI